ILPMGSGGFLGAAIKSLLVSQLNFLGSTVILLSFTLIGITLFTGLSWLTVMDKTGHYGFKLVTLLKQGAIKGLSQGVEKVKSFKHLEFNFEEFKIKPKKATSGTSIVIQPEASSPIVIHEQDDDEDDLPQVMETPQPTAQKRESKPEIKTGTLLTS